MKTLPPILLLIFAPLLNFAQTYQIPLSIAKTEKLTGVVERSFSSVRMYFSLETLYGTDKTTKEGVSFTELYFGKGYSKGDFGTPRLPAFKELIQIPNNAKISVRVLGYSENEYQLDEFGIRNQLYPNQPSVRKDQDFDKLPFHYNASKYEKPGYPENPIASIEVLGTLRGVRIARVDVSPILYDPVLNRIKVYNDIEIEIVFEGNTKADEEIYKSMYSPFFEPIYSRFSNSFSKNIYDERPDLLSQPVVMQIVSHRMFEETLQPYIEWKTRKGFYVNVAYTDEIGTSPQNIQTYVHSKYNNATPENPAPSFLVIVGDVDQVPASATGSSTNKKTDLYYASVDGDYFPEMYYGRLSATNTTQLKSIIDKILYYEQYQFDNPSYLNNATLIAGSDSQWNPRVAEPTVKYATKNYFNNSKGFNAVWGYGVTTDENNPNNSSGYTGCYDEERIAVSMINYTAHCNETSWSGPALYRSRINEMTNTNMYPVAIGNCCLTADFGYSESIGETWIRAENRGAVTYIGSSPNSYWFEDFYWAVGAFPIESYNNGYVPSFDETTLGVYDAPYNSNYITTGGLVFIGNLAVTQAHLNNYSSHSTTRYYWQAYNVLGDPSLVPYLTEADDNIVNHASIFPIGVNSYSVSALPNSLVAISKDGIIHGTSIVGNSGIADVPIVPILDGGDVDIVITRPQTKPYFAIIPAAALDGPFIVLDSYVVNDFEGNNNQKPDYGETFGLHITLKNVGDTPANNIKAKLQGEDNYFIALNPEEVNFGNISAHETDNTSLVNNAFKFTLKDNVTDQYTATFKLEITDGNETWTSNLYLTANAPRLSVNEIVVDDQGQGTPEVLDPGETAILRVFIANTGQSISPSVQALLISSSVYLQVNGASAIFVDPILPGDMVPVEFSISAMDDTPLETLAGLNLILEVNNYGIDNYIELLIGKIPNYIMGTQDSVSTCIGRFYDSGGPDGDYSNNEDYIMTFYPSDEGNALIFSFEYAEIEGTSNNLWDKLYIFDGVDTSAASFSGSPFSNSNGVNIGTITATNPQGAVTFRFTSDESIVMSGWKANISCRELLYKATFIVNNSKEEKVIGAEISIDGIEGLFDTNSEGEISVELPRGNYIYTVNAEGYKNFQSEFSVDNREVIVSVNLVLVGIHSAKESHIKIFPNPFWDEIKVTGLEKASQIQVTNMIGQTLVSYYLSGDSQIAIPLGEISKGIYVVTIFSHTGQKEVFRVVKL